ncbi:MAG: YceI family protein, partial [Pseudomonadota bacterium]
NDGIPDITEKTASFKITKVEPTRSNLYKVTGNLTLRGKTNPETFDVKIEKKGKTMVATGTIKFDRTKYGVTYNSEGGALKKAVKIAKDKIIKDEIQLTLNLTTQAI